MTGPLVLPDDIEIVPVTAFSDAVRAQIGGTDNDYAVTRPLSRFPSKVIDAQAATWLRQFEEPTTLVDAILRHSKVVDRKPLEVLEDIYPFLESCLYAKLLVEPGVESQAILPSFAAGTELVGCRIEQYIQVLADSEIYCVSNHDRRAALKITRPEASPKIKQNLVREALIQERLNGRVAPRLFDSGETDDGRVYLISEWIAGELCTEKAAVLRMSSRDPLPPALLSHCGNILDAYATLHSLGVTHADVHPGNILVERDGKVRIIDYGLSRMECKDDTFAIVPRGGVGSFLDPEYAGAILAGATLPPATFAGEQYSIAAVIYHLVSGRNYLDFLLEKESLLRQIVKEPSVPLTDCGVPGTAALDRVLRRALSKEPSGRFPDVASMATAYWQNVVGLDSPAKDEKKYLRADASAAGKTRARENWLNSFLDGLSDLDAEAHIPRPARTAYRLFRMACIREDANLLALAERCLDRAERGFAAADAGVSRGDARGSEWCESSLGIAWVRALMAHSCWDLHRHSWGMQNFVRCCHESRAARANPSALLASSLLLDAIRWDPNSNHQALIDVGNRLLDRLWDELDRLPPLTMTNRRTSSAPSANWTECLYATLQWMRAARASEPVHLRSRLDQLTDSARCQEERACGPSQAQRRGPVWHTGDISSVFLWTLASRVLGHSRWLRLAEKAGRDATVSSTNYLALSDLVAKAYSQLNLYKHTGDRCWLDHAYEAADAAVARAKDMHPTDAREPSFRPCEENLGLAVLISDLAHPHCSAMPFLEEEGWPAPAG